MSSREQQIAKSIVKAITGSDKHLVQSILSRILSAIVAFFSLYFLKFLRLRHDLFQMLRSQTWQIDEDFYEWSFANEHALQPKGDMGFSGSTFYTTADGRYIIKSVPRNFEHSFFRNDLILPYVDHMKSHPKSLLVRITDFLAYEFPSLGSIVGTAPTHHIIMENLLLGQEEARKAGGEEWQAYDLKPRNYFFPERDIMNGALTSEATKARLVDKFDDTIVLTRVQAEEFLAQLEQDTKLLEQCNAVDYSLFLVRIPLSTLQDQDQVAGEANHNNAPSPQQTLPLAPPSPPTWRQGIKSSDSKYVFRAVVLDFFWAKHKIHAKAFTLLIKAWNLVDRGQGPMSITTTPEEYRTRFLRMCATLVEVKD